MSLLFVTLLLCVGGVRGQEISLQEQHLTINVAYIKAYQVDEIDNAIYEGLRNSLHEELSQIFTQYDTELRITDRSNLRPPFLIVWFYKDSWGNMRYQVTPSAPPFWDISPLLDAAFMVDLLPGVPQSHLTSGLGFYAAGRCDLMEQEFANTLDNLPFFDTDNPYIYSYIPFYQGNCDLLEADFDKAIAVYEAAPIRSIPDLWLYSPFALNLAWTYLQVNRETDAFSMMDEIVETVPERDRTTALVARSQLYALAFRFDEAVADMDAAIELTPDNPYLYVERGQRLLLLYEWDRAIADYNHALELDPNYADAYYYRGILYASAPEGIDARAEAIADFQHYLELAPNGAHAEAAQHYLTQIESQLDSLEATPPTREN